MISDTTDVEERWINPPASSPVPDHFWKEYDYQEKRPDSAASEDFELLVIKLINTMFGFFISYYCYNNHCISFFLKALGR